MQLTVNDVLSKPQTIPSIPKVVTQLIESFNDPSPDIVQIAKLIEHDEGIAIKVLRLANTSKFGSARQVSSVQDASVRLGLDSLRTLVLASGLTAAVTKVPHLDLKQFWTRSFDVADVGGELAGPAGIKPDSMKTIGMLHNIGEVALHNSAPEQALVVVACVANGDQRAAAETKEMGVTSAEVGSEMVRRWRLPEFVCEAIGQQHEPELIEAKLLRVAMQVVKDKGIEYGEAPPAHFPVQLLEDLGIMWPSVKHAHDVLIEHGNQFAELLG
ncbi:HDOD domain-containing protein [Salinibius halmophilus]|uniref:HDOD domain-containing protein n=1 Tax=Salinibius halmophilus TaxID=1853216 RepID=UPI000E66B9B3|nr:HDOD domain-containing protein [Salinibius halmophilus]